MEALPNLVTRLPRSVNSVRTVTYLNEPMVGDENTDACAPEKDHAVVAGHPRAQAL
jgi:hypothetical protein